MTQEDKQLLLQDLCARLLYGVKVQINSDVKKVVGVKNGFVVTNERGMFSTKEYITRIECCRPYLRPMSSMTEEERIEFSRLLVKRYCEEDWEGHISTSYCIEIDNVYTDDENRIKYPSPFSMDAIDWLNAHYFDYRGLLDKGFAIEASDDMYETK